MSRLVVEAVPNESLATVGSKFGVELFVSVTDDAGKPVEGLTHANFKVNLRHLLVGSQPNSACFQNSRTRASTGWNSCRQATIHG
jgi:hypothetical protein